MPADSAAESRSPWVIDVSEENFVREAIDRSVELPVVVDFWAPWCAPCRQLGPVLEKLAAEYDGKFLLVKANTEQLPNIAGQFGVQSIPYVVALRHRKLVHEFVGALGEKEIRAWLQSILPSPTETLIQEARAVEGADPAAAMEKYQAALKLSPDDPAVKIGLARLLLAGGSVAESRQLIEQLSQRGYLEPEAEALSAELALRERGEEVGDVAACRAAVAAAPDDLTACWRLAQALASARQWEESLDLCLRLVQRDRKGLGEQARAMMVDMFHTLGSDSELTTTYRRKLSSALY